MHNGFITVNEEKMSKSLGNFFTVREILDKYDPEVVRFYMISTHYRSPLDFDDTKLEMNKKSLVRLHNAFDNLEAILKGTSFEASDNVSEDLNRQCVKLRDALLKAEQDFREAMEDDFNTALAVASLFDLARDINSFIGNLSSHVGDGLPAFVRHVLEETRGKFLLLGGVLGLFENRGSAKDNGSELVEKLMDLIIEVRQEARAKKDWAIADAIRNKLGELGIILEDSPRGVRWKRK